MDCDDGSLEAVDDEAFIAIANELLGKCNLPGKVTRLEECSDNFFVGVYKGLLGDDLQGIIENPISAEQHIRNCQTVINLIASDVLNVDLSHISGKAIVEGDRISIRNFLEIFAGLLEYFMEYVNDEGSDEDDSNLLTSEHDVISGVLREEFGPSYDFLYGPRPQTSRPSQFRDDAQLSREMSQLPSAAGTLHVGHKRNAQGRSSAAADFATWDAGNSTGFDADTSKLSDTRADVVRDSTAELIRLGETTSDRVPSKSPERKETIDNLPDSTSVMSAPTPMIPGTSQEASRVFSDDATGGIMDGQRSGQAATGRQVLGDTVLSQRSESARTGPVGYTTRKPGTSSLLSRDATSIEDELTQYTLTPTELTDSSVSKDKGDDKPSASFMSTSSTSAGWPEQISPLEPSKDSTGRETSGFDALGVRPREQPVASEVTDVRSGNSSGRSTPVYHHYHHHFHHTQPQERVPGFQSVAGVSAATTVDIPSGPASHLSRSEPSVAATKPGLGLAERLTKTAPGAFIYPLTGDTYPSAAVPRSVSTVSSTGFTQPPLAAVRGTTSTLTDSVFLSGSGSSRPSVRASSAAVTSDVFGGTARPLITTSATSSAGSSLPVSSTVSSTSHRPHGAAWGSLADRTSKPLQSDGVADRLSRLKRPQPLASTLPARLQTRITDVEHHPVHRSTVGEELLAKYSTKGAEESEDSESEREYEDEDLAQNSDSAVDYGRIGPTTTRMTGDTSTSRPTSRAERSIKGPGTPHSYKESTEEDSSPERLARRGVKFRDTVETFPVSGRMDRLRRLLYEEAEEQRKRQTKAIRKTYRDQLKEIQQEKEREKTAQHKRKLPLSPSVPKKKPKKKSPVKKRGRLEAVYRSQNRKSRPKKISSTVKGRKRSASASPVLGRRRSDSLDHPEVLLPAMLEEFPFLHVSPQTAHSMWNKQARHLSSVLKSSAEAKKTKTQRMIEDAEKRQEALVGILKKDLDHNLRMREKQERQHQQRTVKAKLREKRQVSARARRYYDEYELRMRARMLKRRTREEQIFKRLFEDGLDIQKQRIRELREYAKEKRETLAQKQQNEIESLENFYRDQFALLAEGIARERYEMEVREKAQEKVVRQMRGDLRKKLERDVREFQENLQRDEDSAYFRQLEADRLRTKFQLATRSAFY